ncbi:hypothetical protein DYBT9275_00984 [Dyadobacter sp. CECT 9275]|uniref:DUF892 family protein n=1 Tax=Dyadobacter helix TaxID=2822344 RepID=A0A916NB80_9BACT|nr:DUF892 family protein [Dyadobacter sp. CECT 9275]CAG4992545.1 hypothetical protein DYBT9275_00984 [Dyadobacter sp. CECT 9275]
MNLDREDLEKFFIHHLNKVYAAKTLLVAELPEIMDESHFKDIRTAMIETVESVKKQIERMDEIYAILPAEFSEIDSKGLKGLVEDAFEDIRRNGENLELRDMSILFYLHNIESIEMASFQILEMASVKIHNDRIKELIRENYEDAKADRTLLLLINAKYIATV